MIDTPFAQQFRPRTIDQVVGQHHLIDPGKPLRALIDQKKPISFIFHGPPGVGKTTLAHVIANEWQLPFASFNASTDNKAQLNQILKKYPDQSFILLVDEIHRLTKPLQDFLLSKIESGNIILIGATTENPIITIAPAIRSRCLLFELKPIKIQDVTLALENIYHQIEPHGQITSQLLQKIAMGSHGDVRTSINLFQSLYQIYGEHLTNDNIAGFLKDQGFIFDKNGDQHYDTISAFQKSIRGWDTDAALYYAGILMASNDLETLSRRLKIIAYEDIGLADPQAATDAITAINTAHDVGMPEARLPISFAIIRLCLANHSNSAHDAINAAMEDAMRHEQYPIPNHLKDTHYSGSQKLGHTGYQYAHNFKHDWVLQQYLPTALQTRQYYQPHQNKQEQAMAKKYYGFKAQQNQKFQRKDSSK